MIDPAAYAKDTEHSQQTALMIFITNRKASMAIAPFTDAQFDLLQLIFAIPNGGTRDAKVGADLKAEGVKAGVPDLFLPVPAQRPHFWYGEYHGLWIEMKRPATATQRKGGIKPEQAKWHTDLIGQGYACVTCYTWLEAVETLWEYLNGRLEQN